MIPIPRLQDTFPCDDILYLPHYPKVIQISPLLLLTSALSLRSNNLPLAYPIGLHPTMTLSNVATTKNESTNTHDLRGDMVLRHHSGRRSDIVAIRVFKETRVFELTNVFKTAPVREITAPNFQIAGIVRDIIITTTVGVGLFVLEGPAVGEQDAVLESMAVFETSTIVQETPAFLVFLVAGAAAATSTKENVAKLPIVLKTARVQKQPLFRRFAAGAPVVELCVLEATHVLETAGDRKSVV